jgi:tRNA A37 threonylcarbamoyladenosine dehydratase
MIHQFTRTEILLGKGAMKTLAKARVAIFGIGGVGSYTAEALARCGIGAFDLVDDDKICLTNLNRQLIATRKTIGKQKTEVMKERILDINPEADVVVHTCFYDAKTESEFDFSTYDYVVDAIDTVTSKLLLIEQAKKSQVPVISCMGAGNKLDPTRFEVADIYKTSMCPLAKVMRHELRAMGILSLKVVYSKEPPIKPDQGEATSCKTNCVCPPGTQRKCDTRRQVPGSVSFVPSVAGLILAGEVVRDLTGVRGC